MLLPRTVFILSLLQSLPSTSSLQLHYQLANPPTDLESEPKWAVVFEGPGLGHASSGSVKPAASAAVSNDGSTAEPPQPVDFNFDEISFGAALPVLPPAVAEEELVVRESDAAAWLSQGWTDDIFGGEREGKPWGQRSQETGQDPVGKDEIEKHRVRLELGALSGNAEEDVNENGQPRSAASRSQRDANKGTLHRMRLPEKCRDGQPHDVPKAFLCAIPPASQFKKPTPSVSYPSFPSHPLCSSPLYTQSKGLKH